MDQIFSIQSERIVNNDFTVRFKGQWFQLLVKQNKTVLQKSKVIIEERMDGEIKIMQKDIYLNFKKINKHDL